MCEKRNGTAQSSDLMKPIDYFNLLLSLRTTNLTIWRFLLIVIMGLIGLTATLRGQDNLVLGAIFVSFLVFAVSNSFALVDNIKARTEVKNAFQKDYFGNVGDESELRDQFEGIVNLLSPFDQDHTFLSVSNKFSNYFLYTLSTAAFLFYLVLLMNSNFQGNDNVAKWQPLQVTQSNEFDNDCEYRFHLDNSYFYMDFVANDFLRVSNMQKNYRVNSNEATLLKAYTIIDNEVVYLDDPYVGELQMLCR